MKNENFTMVRQKKHSEVRTMSIASIIPSRKMSPYLETRLNYKIHETRSQKGISIAVTAI